MINIQFENLIIATIEMITSFVVNSVEHRF